MNDSFLYKTEEKEVSEGARSPNGTQTLTSGGRGTCVAGILHQPAPIFDGRGTSS